MNIPAWEKCRLDEIGVFRKGAGISKASVGSGNVACIRYGEIYTDFGPYMKKVFSRISRTIADQSVKLEYGDIVFAGSGETHEEIGKCTAYVLNEPVYAGGDTIIFHPKVKCNSLFLGYLLNTPIVNQQKAQMGQGDAIVHISAKSLGKIELFLPNYEEQTAIATALSDTDALIDSLEKLIAKKQAIKQGAMQELLTGKRRLERFSGEWKKIPIGSCFDFKNGLNKAKDYFGSGTPIVNYMDVYQKNSLYAKDIRGTVTLSYAEIKRYEVKKGDVFFTRTSETPEEVGIASVLLEDVKDCVFSGFVLRARPKNDILYDKFCKYCFATVAVREQIISNCTYTTRALTNGNLLSKIVIAVPDKDEQIAITTILDDMDNEISALQKKLDKIRRIKQGMMAELLTGRIRLI